jgi:hypothetical protein
VRLRVAAVLVVAALGAGYLVGYTPPPRETGPGAALRAYQRARVDALGECAKHGYATQWGDVAPDSRVALECMGLSVQPCTSYPVPAPPSEDADHGPRL